MFSPLTQSIIEREKIPVLSNDDVDAFLSENREVVLFVSGAHERLVEVDDVAVIFPELVKAYGGRLSPAIIDRECERDVQKRYLFNAFPVLVFLRDGKYLGAIKRVLDWSDYVREINDILARDASDPVYKFPEGCAPALAAAQTKVEH